MWGHVTPLSSCPALENETRGPGERGSRERKEGARAGRSDPTPTAGRTSDSPSRGIRLLERETAEGSSAPGSPQELLRSPGRL